MVQKGLLPEREALAVQEKANETGLSFVEHLVAIKRFNETEVAEFAAHTFGFPLVDLNAFDPDHLPAKLIDARALQSRRALPLFQRGNRVFVAISDPTNERRWTRSSSRPGCTSSRWWSRTTSSAS